MPDNILRFRGASQGVWQTLKPAMDCPAPGNVQPWIRLQTSMTKQLKDRFGPGVAVRLLNCGMGDLHDDEQTLFTPSQTRGYVREVVLHAGGVDLMTARTVITSSDLYSDEKIIRLGNTPLGELLFAKGKAEWLKREFAKVAPDAAIFKLVRKAAGDSAPDCWARRSLYLLEKIPLLVTEVFLPAMLAETSVKPAAPNVLCG